MLELKNLEYEILREKIVRDFSLSVKSGKIYTLFGPSGCGKTTILRLITGLNELKRGEIINNFKKTTYLFQENRLLEYKTALQNISIATGISNDEICEFALKFGLSKKDLAKYPDELSGGMRARVSFVRALLNEPDLLLLDEPFSGLDTHMRGLMMNEILRRVRDGMSVLLVTHDHFEAAKLSDEIVFLSQKGMQILSQTALPLPQEQRNEAILNKIASEKFTGRIYFD